MKKMEGKRKETEDRVVNVEQSDQEENSSCPGHGDYCFCDYYNPQRYSYMNY